jgi:hypothetical protein
MSERRRSELRPTFFMSRGNGVFTPLIPADELPTDMVIVGVPKIMGFGETTGMTSVGEIMASSLQYEIKVGTDIDQQCEAKNSLTAQLSRASNAVLVGQPGAGGSTASSSATSGSFVATSPITPARPVASLSVSVVENTSRANPNTSSKCDHHRSDGLDQDGTTDNAEGPSPSSVSLGKSSPELTSKDAGLDMPSRSSLGAQVSVPAAQALTELSLTRLPGCYRCDRVHNQDLPW